MKLYYIRLLRILFLVTWVYYVAEGADALDSIHKFKDGESAKAETVNGNFDLLVQEIRRLRLENERLAQSLAANNPSNELPVGTIAASMLSPATFEKRLLGWVLADGREVSWDTKYAEVMKKNRIPDLRAMFLRGIDVRRNDRFADPIGERDPGSEQPAEVEKHSHLVARKATATSEMSPNVAVANVWDHNNVKDYEIGGTESVANVGLSSPHGGSETRPNNVAVFYYIKVD